MCARLCMLLFFTVYMLKHDAMVEVFWGMVQHMLEKVFHGSTYIEHLQLFERLRKRTPGCNTHAEPDKRIVCCCVFVIPRTGDCKTYDFLRDTSG